MTIVHWSQSQHFVGGQETNMAMMWCSIEQSVRHDMTYHWRAFCRFLRLQAPHSYHPLARDTSDVSRTEDSHTNASAIVICPPAISSGNHPHDQSPVRPIQRRILSYPLAYRAFSVMFFLIIVLVLCLLWSCSIVSCGMCVPGEPSFGRDTTSRFSRWFGSEVRVVLIVF